ncbi:PrgI family protein [Candidatus Uhrbacteria bacterium]|nr:PrgI family protein [Candidatus Uhrbacteria bacterium]
MPDQFVVPQFIDAEDKIFGPITARQFIILMIAGLLDFGLFKLLSFVPFLLVGVPIVIIAGTVAFAKINGQVFHYFLLNIIQTFKKPKLRIWDKKYSDSELKIFMKQAPPELPKIQPRKAPISISRLNELSLIVNTGGIYQPEE